MDATERLDEATRLCRRDALVDGGRAVGFAIRRGGRDVAGFVVAWDDRVHAFVNVCPHRGTTLDWKPGEVFDETGLYLICATHGAMFEPDSGRCIAGPCTGARLQPIAVRVADGFVELVNDQLVTAAG
ncbi:MAG TPA: Rieske 2Fe-2S domain-containing protein [Usitatibacteraceae bacterium]|nr:Rieske 2Fe-2S domain-containing protein [Usitatibacteraceae bacterium]